MLENKLIRKEFPMLNKKMQDHDLIFFDNASTTFKPKCVIDAITNYYTNETSNSHRGDYDLCFNIDKKIDETRGNIASFINAEKKEIVFTSGTSMSINLIAFGYGFKYLNKGDEILISEAEHASNSLPWFKLKELKGVEIKFVPLDKNGRITIENIKKIATKNTKLISLAMVGNVLGYVAPIKEISKFAHENNIIFACDGAQAVPHMKIDVKDLDVDFLSFSGHKMYGPTGIGVLYGKYDLLNKMDPLITGGGMNGIFKTSCEVTYLDAPTKFEAGTLNIAGIIGFNEAINFIKRIGIENINQYEKELRDYAVSKIKEIKDVIIYNPNADAGIITLNKSNVFAQDEATYLNSKGIAVRSGQHCAKMLNDYLNTVATIRVSFALYNNKTEIDKFVEELKKGDFLDAYFA